MINNFLDNLTKVTGKHTLKSGFFYQRASNASNSQNRVQSDIDFANNASNPLNTGWRSRMRCWAFTMVHPGQHENYPELLLSGHLRIRAGHVEGYSAVTLDLGIRLSYYEPYHNILGPESFFNPNCSIPAKPRAFFGLPASAQRLALRARRPTGRSTRP